MADIDAVSGSTPETSPPARRWTIGRFEFDPAARTLTADGASERISGKAAAVLLRLAEHAGEVVSRDQLIAEVWNGNAYTGATALTHTVSQLRGSLRRLATPGSAAAPLTEPGELPTEGAGPAAQAPESDGAIETISKSGYRLLWPAQRVALPPVPVAETPSPASNAQPPAPAAPDRRLGWAAGLLVLFIATTVFFYWQQHRGVSPPGAADRAMSTLTSLEGVEESPTYSPDGHQLAYVWRRTGAPARLRIVDARQPQAEARELSDPLDQIYHPVWTDAHHIAYLQAVHGEGCRVIWLDLRDGQRRDLAACYYLSGAAALAASPDGEWLAFTRRAGPTSGEQALMLHHIASGKERTLARPIEGLGYGDMAWSHDGRFLAVLQLRETVGDVVRLDVASGEALRLTPESGPIWALAWRSDDSGLIFSAGLAGDFAIWQVPASGGTPSRFARIDNVRSLVAMPDGTGDVAASVVRHDDHISLYSVADNSLREAIRSSNRDLYAEACGDAAHPVFVSFRTRRVGAWYRDGETAEARELQLPPGTPEPPTCSPDGRRYATVLSPNDGTSNRLVIGTLAAGAAPEVIPVAATLGSPSWSADGRTLIMASDRGGPPELWRFDPESRAFSRLTTDHGRYGREVVVADKLWLYYAREGQRGLWRRPLNAEGAPDGPTEAVVADLSLQDWGNWAWHAGALWRVLRTPAGDQLVRRDATGQDQTRLSLPAGSIGPFRSLSIDRQGQALLSQHGPTQADIMRVPESP